jgi:apolipoprotein N-acyltransferase
MIRSNLSFTWREQARTQPFGVPIAVGSGLLMGLLHLPSSFAFLAFIPLATWLFAVAREDTARMAARVAFWGGLAFWAVHLFWLPQSFASELGKNFGPFAAIGIWVLFPIIWIIEAGAMAGMAWLAHRFTKNYLSTLAALALLMVLLEFIRSLTPIAFPWGNFGYTLLQTPLAQIAQLGGVYLVSLLVYIVATAFAAIGFAQWRWLWAVPIVVGSSLAYGLTRPAPTQATRPVYLVQTNNNSFDNFVGRNLGRAGQNYRRLAAGAKPGVLTVFPEAAIALDEVADLNPPVLGPLTRAKVYPFFDPPKAERLITGVADYRQGRRVNSVAAIKNTRLLGTSTKAHLVPFSEFMPWQKELGFIYAPILQVLGLSGTVGSDLIFETRVLELDGVRYGTYVCYDSVFPDVARARAATGAQVLVNVSNDSWFGDTWGLQQHFQMGRMRAIETNRWVLRSGNTGVTAIIDSLGQVRQHVPSQKELTLEGLYALENTVTPYVRFGDWVIWLIAALLGLVILTSRRVGTAF